MGNISYPSDKDIPEEYLFHGMKWVLCGDLGIFIMRLSFPSFLNAITISFVVISAPISVFMMLCGLHATIYDVQATLELCSRAF